MKNLNKRKEWPNLEWLLCFSGSLKPVKCFIKKVYKVKTPTESSIKLKVQLEKMGNSNFIANENTFWRSFLSFMDRTACCTAA
jgi:hypothetical protein